MPTRCDSHASARSYVVVDVTWWCGQVVRAFNLNVCGFDLLRTANASYICDVNGWSFVKKSHKYYDDCAAILARMIIEAVAPERMRCDSVGQRLWWCGRAAVDAVCPGLHRDLMKYRVPAHVGITPPPAKPVTKKLGNKQAEELRCVIAVIRHADRTPKQKMKMTVRNPAFMELFRKYDLRARGGL